MELFDFIKNCFTKKEDVTPTENQFDSYFIVTRFLSMNKTTLVPTVYVNNVANNLPKWAVGCLLFWVTPKQNTAPRINYIKKPKVDAKEKELIQLIGQRYCCSHLHAKQYLDLLRGQGVNVAGFFGRK